MEYGSKRIVKRGAHKANTARPNDMMFYSDFSGNRSEGGMIKELSHSPYCGPGVWYSLHTLAINARTKSRKKEFITIVVILRDNFKCMVCRNHWREYMDTHPIEEYFDVLDSHGNDVGMFKWTWIFHNHVNARLGKPHMDYQTAYNLYSQPEFGVCLDGCGEASNRWDHLDEETERSISEDPSWLRKKGHAKTSKNRWIR
jgi:hypothetical protein